MKTFDEMMSYLIEYEEKVDHGYIPTEEEENRYFFYDEKIKDWSSDVEYSF
jgi:hypothetical protein